MWSYQRKTESYFHSDLRTNLWLNIHDICIWSWEVRTASGCSCLLSQLSRNYLDLLFILGVNMETNIFQVKLLNIFLMVCSHFHKKSTKYVPTLLGQRFYRLTRLQYLKFIDAIHFLFLPSCNFPNFKDDYLLVIWHITSRLLNFSRYYQVFLFFIFC